jgi:hypothetical protein
MNIVGFRKNNSGEKSKQHNYQMEYVMKMGLQNNSQESSSSTDEDEEEEKEGNGRR